MTDGLLLLIAVLAVLACTILPAVAALRLLGGDRWNCLALAPSLGAAGAGVGAILASFLGVPWGLPAYAAVMALVIIAAALLRRLGVRLALDDEHKGENDGAGLFSAVPGAWWWLVGAAAIALAPLGMAFGRADGILQRWDTLYHLNALARIRTTGDGSSLTLGAISSTTGRTATYPAAFHDLAAVVPGVPTPILLNAAVLALAVVPWVLGLAVLARALWPQHAWGPFAAAVLALLAPASPVDEWVHLSPIPNLTGMAMLPGVLAGGLLTWRRVLARLDGADPTTGRGEITGAVLVLAAAGTGLTLLHPNVAVTALILLAVMTGSTGVARWRRCPALAAVPLLLLLPVALLSWTPLASMVTGFTGGLIVPWWKGLGEILVGLPTVWPMAIGVVLAGLWWPGLVLSWRTSSRWVVIGWLVIAVLYMDAAVDSPLNLSTLYYRGQDRLSMPLTMLCILLAVPGLAAWSAALGRSRAERSRPVVIAMTVIAVLIACTSFPPRLEHARMNADLSYPGRPRFLQADELASFEALGGEMDPHGQLLASPFSGGSHLYAIRGQNVRFPVAGMTLSREDRAVIEAVGSAGSDPAACRVLREAGVRYVYQDWTPYSFDPWYAKLNRGGEGLGPVLFTTSHSRLIEVDCDAG